MVDSRRLTLPATKVQWTPPFGIVLCSVDLFGSVAALGLEVHFDDGGG